LIPTLHLSVSWALPVFLAMDRESDSEVHSRRPLMVQETASPNEEVSNVLAFVEASSDQDSLQNLSDVPALLRYGRLQIT
jgi:hypothetical protein